MTWVRIRIPLISGQASERISDRQDPVYAGSLAMCANDRFRIPAAQSRVSCSRGFRFPLGAPCVHPSGTRALERSRVVLTTS